MGEAILVTSISKNGVRISAIHETIMAKLLIAVP
jgi:hypothetical protein